jgi:hypothetical protein
MKHTTFVFAGIISAIIGTAYAVGENTVTSKAYVDAMDATKQNTIPATGTNASTPGSTVVTYTGTAGTIGERAIFDYETGWDEGWVAEGHETDLVPAEAMSEAINGMISDSLNGLESSQEPVRVVKTTCANSPDCTLWEMQDVVVQKLQCETVSDCSNSGVGCRAPQIRGCVGGMCRCVDAD